MHSPIKMLHGVGKGYGTLSHSEATDVFLVARRSLNGSWGHDAKCNKPDTKGQIPCDPTSVRHLQ